MSYTILRGRWCDILNVHAPTEDDSDETKDSFHEELRGVSDRLPKYHIKILLSDFNER
jgi:hydroxypyruvate isomerase